MVCVMTPGELTQQLKAEARRLGFDGVGIAPAVAPPGYASFVEWLRSGHAAGMTYMERHAEAREHPDHVLEGVRSVVMVSIIYGAPSPESSLPTQGKVARYARGIDYHRVLWDKLDDLLDWLRRQSPDVRGRAVVDTAPLLERDFARLAGLGWIGKNTMLIDRRLGSFTFLGALLADCELEYDVPHASNHCGTCTRCLDACPTVAFVGPYQLDARRCIAYWTIEHRGAISGEFADQLHGWVFGCDICQDVCPWNRKAPAGRVAELGGGADWTSPDLVEWLGRDRGSWHAALRRSALARTKREGLLRNAALVLGQRRVAEAVPHLETRLADLDEDPAVRLAAAWALGRIGGEIARAALQRSADCADPEVRQAIARALVDAETTLQRESLPTV
jgi:epoxyqueuosine reductase